MLETHAFGGLLKAHGFDFYAGVPCSFLKYLINYAQNECQYVAATNEGDAVATCAGAALGGRKTVFLCQNSGLTNATSPLVSLNYPFKIPVLGFVTLRGETGLGDEPQHELMGKITASLLDAMEITWEYLSQEGDEAKAQVEKANALIEKGESFFFLVRKGTFSEVALKDKARSASSCDFLLEQKKEPQEPKRFDMLKTLMQLKDQDSIFLATTGYTGRELYEVEDAPNNFYMVGSMGCVGALGLGLALAQPNKKIIVIDGDGALLMRMGVMATMAYYQPDNLFHLLLDNGAYESTGGQSTVSDNINFTSIAASLKYNQAIYLHDLDELKTQYQQWSKSPALTFAYLKIQSGSPDELSRPDATPEQVKQRLMKFLHRR